MRARGLLRSGSKSSSSSSSASSKKKSKSKKHADDAETQTHRHRQQRLVNYNAAAAGDVGGGSVAGADGVDAGDGGIIVGVESGMPDPSMSLVGPLRISIRFEEICLVSGQTKRINGVSGGTTLTSSSPHTHIHIHAHSHTHTHATHTLSLDIFLPLIFLLTSFPPLFHPFSYSLTLLSPSSSSGLIRPGKFTAILGGSGAGKTSLMSCLLGRETITSGTIEFLATTTTTATARGSSGSGSSGDREGGGFEGGSLSPAVVPLSSTQQQRLVGFVPQFDVFLRSMTVLQLLTHSARTRLPADMTGKLAIRSILPPFIPITCPYHRYYILYRYYVHCRPVRYVKLATFTLFGIALSNLSIPCHSHHWFHSPHTTPLTPLVPLQRRMYSAWWAP